MSWLGDLGSFEAFNAKGMWNQIKENPARLLYGSADPFSTNMWNGILGTDDKPMIDQFGGAADHRYEEAQDAGINTGAGKTAHTVAKAIASFYAGGAAAGAMGGAAGGASGAGASGAGTAGGGLLGSSTGTTASAGYGLGQPLATGTMGNASYAGTQGGLLGSSGGGFLQTGKQYMEAAKPYTDAAQTGMSINNQVKEANQQPPIQAAQIMQAQGSGPDALAALAAQGQQARMAQMQSAEAARQQRRMGRRGLL